MHSRRSFTSDMRAMLERIAAMASGTDIPVIFGMGRKMSPSRQYSLPAWTLDSVEHNLSKSTAAIGNNRKARRRRVPPLRSQWLLGAILSSSAAEIHRLDCRFEELCRPYTVREYQLHVRPTKQQPQRCRGRRFLLPALNGSQPVSNQSFVKGHNK
ncbi:hypothetical protein MRX96_054187 [Rhipicephalus microplus]